MYACILDIGRGFLEVVFWQENRQHSFCDPPLPSPRASDYHDGVFQGSNAS